MILDETSQRQFCGTSSVTWGILIDLTDACQMLRFLHFDCQKDLQTDSESFKETVPVHQRPDASSSHLSFDALI